jgi:hypothetical protein
MNARAHIVYLGTTHPGRYQLEVEIHLNSTLRKQKLRTA